MVRHMLRGVLLALLMISAAAAEEPVSQAPAPIQRPADQRVAKALFGAMRTPSHGMAQPMGSYAKGCLAGGVELPANGPGWQVMRPSRNRAWGHPDLIAAITHLAGEARKLGWHGILVGDMAQPRGGPMLTGHRSHQTGLDADIWLLPAPAHEQSRLEREETSAVSVVAPDRRHLNAHWTPGHHALLRAAATMPQVERIFVNAAIKARLCADETGDRRWLRKLRPWWGHDAHMHIRLYCPAGSPLCEGQDPIAEGDGCTEVQGWLTDEALNAVNPNMVKPPPDVKMADLPAACAGLVE